MGHHLWNMFWASMYYKPPHPHIRSAIFQHIYTICCVCTLCVPMQSTACTLPCCSKETNAKQHKKHMHTKKEPPMLCMCQSRIHGCACAGGWVVRVCVSHLPVGLCTAVTLYVAMARRDPCACGPQTQHDRRVWGMRNVVYNYEPFELAAEFMFSDIRH